MQTKQSNKNKSIIAVLLFSLTLIFSCSEKYWPELHSDFEHLLVVDGKISNEPGPYTIKLSTSSAIEDTEFNPLSGARITIMDNEGNSELLLENEEGVYQTNPAGIQGVIGRQYKISIEVNDKTYESSFETLRDPVEIESIGAEWVNRKGATDEENEFGYQFYISTAMANEAENFYYWEISETYHFQVLYSALMLYWGNSPQGKSGFEYMHKGDSLKNCWNTSIIDKRYTYTTKNLSTPKIDEYPINFTPNGIKFRFKYALQVKQFSISENAYAFLSSLQEQNDIENSLYTSQPFQILGNIFNVNDPEEPVLGYFLTAGVFVSPPLLIKRPPGYGLPVNFGFCKEITSENTTHVIENVLNMPPYYWPVVVASNPDSETPQPMFVDQECVDCRTNGGIPVRPDYWDDDSLLFKFDTQTK